MFAPPLAKPRTKSAAAPSRRPLSLGTWRGLEQRVDRSFEETLRRNDAGPSNDCPASKPSRASAGDERIGCVDAFELESERIADQVLRAQNSQAVVGGANRILRLEEPEALNRRAAVRGCERPGESLPSAVRSQFETRFGHSFSRVRVHADGEAASAAGALQARAYTIGNDIVFGTKQYAPETVKGKWLLAHELTHVVQQRESLGRDPRGAILRQSATITPKQEVKKYVTLFMPDYGGLSADLLGHLPADTDFVNQVFDILAESDQAIVASGLASRATDDQLAKISADGDGKRLLWRVVGSMRKLSSVAMFEKDQERVLFSISPEHKRLKGESFTKTPEVKAALQSSGAKLQSIESGWASGVPQFDEYSVTIDAMPPGVAPEAFLSEMATDLNKTVNDFWFDVINEFKRTKTDAPPAVGDIYHIDIKGPDDGSVMLVERAADHFIFSTVATAQDGTHPEYGSREFGFEKNSDGSVRFYTRGASRSGMMPGTTLMGRPLQKVGWTRLVTGIGNSLAARGGRVRPGSVTSWRTQE